MNNLVIRTQYLRLIGAAALLGGFFVAGLDAPVVRAASTVSAVTLAAPLLPETVSAGGFHTCGIRSDGTLACWGSNTSGQSTPPAGNFTQVSAGGNHTCALRTDGTLACWGSNGSGQATPPVGVYTQVSAGTNHTCAVKLDGTLACWGSDAAGQASPPAGNFTQVSAGELHACGLKSDESLACWGSNANGQLILPAGTFLQVDAGGYHTCAVESDRTLTCWGDNRNGQATPPTGTFTQVSGGYWHTCGIKSDGTLACWGDNRNGQASLPPLFVGTYTQASAGRYHTCAVRNDGTLNCWGRNSSGQAPVLAVNPAYLPYGEVGIAYTQTLSGSGGLLPYFFSLVSGSLPPGMSLSTAGLLSGFPTTGGLYTFAIQAQDTSALPFSVQRKYDLTVIVNTPPEADDDTFTVNEDSTNNPLDVLAGDTDFDDDPLTVSAVSDPPHGTAVDHDIDVLYTPDAGYVGGDSFTYTVSDGMGGSDTATVIVTVTNVNDAPVADDDAFTVNEDSASNSLDVLDGDTDVEGDPLTITAISDPPHGAAVDHDTYLGYTPDPNYFGSDVFTYTISDGKGGFDTATVTVTVTNVNDPPIANNDVYTVNEDTTNNVQAVRVNDTDPDGNPLTVFLVSDPPHGSAVDKDAHVLYAPDANYFGTDSYTYTISDGQGGFASATVTVTVRNVNDPPVADDDTFTVNEDSLNNTLDVLNGDSDLDGNLLQVASVSNPPHGTAVDNNANVIYFPDANFNGMDTFTYSVSDGSGGSDTATVTVTVLNINDVPTADNDSFTVIENSISNGLAVLVGDSDPDGDPLTVSSVSDPPHGSTVDNDTEVLYTPDPNYSGLDSFTYSISDGNGGTDSAIVTITVTNVNNAPIADDDAFTVSEDSVNNSLDVLAGDTDFEGDPLIVSSVSHPAHGTALDNNINVLYTPELNFSGTDTFTYSVTDGNGGSDTATVTVTVINANNDAPSASDDAFTVVEDSLGNPLDVLANDSDPDGDMLTVLNVSNPLHGTATPSNNNLYYTPDPDYFGMDSFTYTVSDGNGSLDTATVTITVNNANNDPPTADDDQFTIAEDGVAVFLDVLAGDSDLDGDPLTVWAVTNPANGTAVDDDSGVLYTPEVNFNGTDSFSYTVSDGQGGVDTATVTVVVTEVNDDPLAQDDAFTIGDYPAQSSLDVLVNDSDPDGDELQVSQVDDPANGEATTDGNQVLYTPDPGFIGVEIFTYTVSDSQGSMDVGLITLTVTGENNPPQADDDLFTVTEDSVDNSLDVLDGDTDPDRDTLSVLAISDPPHGAATDAENQVLYTPDPNYNGTDSFTYTVTDGNGGEASATVMVTVTSVNDVPLAEDDTFTVFADSADNALDVLAGDSDADGDPLSVAAVSDPPNGAATANGGNLLYTPRPGFSGLDSCTYTVTDGQGGEATATVTITVTNERHRFILPFVMRRIQQNGLVYQEDFEDGAGGEWSQPQTDTAPNGQRFLGQFGTGVVNLTLNNLPAHGQVRIGFDLYIIRSWDGNEPVHGPDFWGLRLIDQPPLLYTTFSNWVFQSQAYPDGYPGGNHPAQSGAAAVGTLGYHFDKWQQDAVYRIDLVVNHSGESLELAFFAEGLQIIEDESWGLDDIEVNLLP